MEIATVAPALVTGVVALLAGPIFSYFMAKSNARREAVTVKASIVAEIHALVDIIRSRNYLGSLNDGAKGEYDSLTIMFPDENVQVYKANLQKIGLLPPHFARDVVRFYMALTAFKQDVIAGGYLNDPEVEQADKVKCFSGNAKLLKDALAIGDSLKEG